MFVLVGRTNGDDLVPSETKNIVCSESRTYLEALAVKMTEQRDEWLREHESVMETSVGTIVYPRIFAEFFIQPIEE